MPISTTPDELPLYATDGDYSASGRTWHNTPRRVATGIDAWAAAGATPEASRLAQSENEWLARVAEGIAWLRGEVGGGTFGDASDGNATMDPGNHTLSRDMYYYDLVVEAGAALNTSGFRLFVAGTLTIEAGAVVHNDGTDAVGTANGVGGMAGSLAGGGDGAAGRLDSDNASGVSANTVTTAIGGAGGAGGAADVHAGGTSAATAPAAALGGYRHIHAALGRASGSATTQFGGGAGGGAGASDTALGSSGAGGGGGGLVAIFAYRVDNAGTIRANGGNGSNAGAAGVGSLGGGGGGGGGGVWIVHREAVGASLGTVQANGGTGGTGTSASTTGTNGAAGSAGRVITLVG